MSQPYEPVFTETTHVSSEKPEECPESLIPKTSNSKGPRFGKRHEQVLMYGYLDFLLASVKSSMSIGIVAMTDSTASINPNIPTYNWTNKSIILSGYVWGNMCPHFVAGWLATRYGPKWILIGCTFICSVLNLLLPTIASYFGATGVLICRVLQGITQGFSPSSINTLLAKWVPPQERSRLVAVASGGLSAGIVVTMFTSGYIAASWYGWPLIFYLNSALGMLWSIVFSFVGSNSPADHLKITQEEKYFIENGLAQKENKGKLSVPWTKILTSSSYLAFFMVHCGYSFGFYIILLEISVYLKKVMKFDIKSNGVLSTLPYILKWMSLYVFGFISDMLINKKICATGTARKIMVFMGSAVPCVTYILLGNCGPEHVNIAIAMLIVGVGFTSALQSAAICNTIDLSPNYAGVLFGTASQISLICSAIGPVAVQYVVTDETNINQWRIIFYFTSAISVLTTTIFTLFGSGETQPWNDNVEERNFKEENNL